MQPTITIIIPVYKCEAYIERCVRSLMEQTMKVGLEFLFVNDCTPDGSMAILRRVIDEYPARAKQVTIIENEQNLGVSKTRKLAVKAAKGLYLAWCDSDDWMELDMMEKMLRATNDGTIDVVCCNFRLHYADHTEDFIQIPCKTPDDCLLNRWISGYFPSSLWQQIHKRELFAKSIAQISETSFMEDVYSITLLLYYAKTIAYVGEALYNYDRTNETSLTHIIQFNNADWMEQKRNLDVVRQVLLSNETDYRKYHVCVSDQIINTKLCFATAFDSLWNYYHTYRECYKDINDILFTPKNQRWKTYLVHNLYPLFWWYNRKKFIV